MNENWQRYAAAALGALMVKDRLNPPRTFQDMAAEAAEAADAMVASEENRDRDGPAVPGTRQSLN